MPEAPRAAGFLSASAILEVADVKLSNADARNKHAITAFNPYGEADLLSLKAKQSAAADRRSKPLGQSRHLKQSGRKGIDKPRQSNHEALP